MPRKTSKNRGFKGHLRRTGTLSSPEHQLWPVRRGQWWWRCVFDPVTPGCWGEQWFVVAVGTKSATFQMVRAAARMGGEAPKPKDTAPIVMPIGADPAGYGLHRSEHSAWDSIMPEMAYHVRKIGKLHASALYARQVASGVQMARRRGEEYKAPSAPRSTKHKQEGETP